MGSTHSIRNQQMVSTLDLKLAKMNSREPFSDSMTSLASKNSAASFIKKNDCVFMY